MNAFLKGMMKREELGNFITSIRLNRRLTMDERG